MCRKVKSRLTNVNAKPRKCMTLSYCHCQAGKALGLIYPMRFSVWVNIIIRKVHVAGRDTLRLLFRSTFSEPECRLLLLFVNIPWVFFSLFPPFLYLFSFLIFLYKLSAVTGALHAWFISRRLLNIRTRWNIQWMIGICMMAEDSQSVAGCFRIMESWWRSKV